MTESNYINLRTFSTLVSLHFTVHNNVVWFFVYISPENYEDTDLFQRVRETQLTEPDSDSDSDSDF